jgi:hypothetical protein
MGPKVLLIVVLFTPIAMLAAGVSPGGGARAITQLPKLVYAAFLVALLCVGFGVFAAEAWYGEAPLQDTVSAIRDPKQVADPDYGQGLARLGIIYLPGYEPPPRSH